MREIHICVAIFRYTHRKEKRSRKKTSSAYNFRASFRLYACVCVLGGNICFCECRHSMLFRVHMLQCARRKETHLQRILHIISTYHSRRIKCNIDKDDTQVWQRVVMCELVGRRFLCVWNINKMWGGGFIRKSATVHAEIAIVFLDLTGCSCRMFAWYEEDAMDLFSYRVKIRYASLWCWCGWCAVIASCEQDLSSSLSSVVNLSASVSSRQRAWWLNN